MLVKRLRGLDDTKNMEILMRNRIMGLCTGAILAMASTPSLAATVELSPLGGLPTVISGVPHATLAFRSVSSGPNDHFNNTVSAEAEDASGLMRVFANSGGDVDLLGLGAGQAGAAARISGAGTITGPGSGLVQGRLLYNFHALADTLLSQTGGPIGGRASALFNVSADVGTFFSVFRPGNSFSGFTSAQASLQYASEHIFTAPAPGSPGRTQNIVPHIRNTSTSRSSPSVNNVLSDNDISITLSRVSDFIVEGAIEILFTAQVGDRMRFSADMEAIAAGAPGHVAGINGLNTGVLQLDLPEGFGFTPDDGVFLTQQLPIAAVPLPPSIALMFLGIIGLGFLRKRQKTASDGLCSPA